MKYCGFLYRVLLFVLFLLPAVSAQSGPGGVGKTDGTSKLRLWLKADQLNLSDGTAVSQWSDASGYNRHLTQATGANQPVYKESSINSRPALLFDGNDFFTHPGFSLFDSSSSGLTVYTVFLSSDTNSQRFILSQTHTPGINSLEIGYRTGEGSIQDFGIHRGASRAVTTTTDMGEGTRIFSLTAKASGSTPNNIEIRENGSLQTVQTESTGWIDAGAYPTSANKVVVGARDEINSGVYDGFHYGYLAEVIVFSGTLTEAERTLVDNYLGEKYGITVVGDVYDGFPHEVAGIGEGADGTPVSEAVTGGLTITESGASLDSGEYIVMGHDSPRNELTAFDVPAGVDRRMTRIWRLKRSLFFMSVDTVFSFDLSSAGLNLPLLDASKYVLLFRTADGSAFADKGLVASVSNGKISFTLPDAALTEGYYTLGFKSCTGAGYALDFSGTNQNVYVGDVESLSFTTEFTFMTWARIDTLNNTHRNFFAKRLGGDMEYQFGISNGNKVKLTLSSGDTLEDSTTLIAGQWVHIAVSYNDAANRVKWFINGLNTETDTVTMNPGVNTTTPFTIGSNGNDEYFDGVLDELRIYGNELSDTEVREAMNHPAVGTEPGLVALWKLDENAGSLATDTASPIAGNIVGASWTASPIPLGEGKVETQTETAGTVSFPTLSASLNYSAHSSASVTITEINCPPNTLPITVTPFSRRYWVVNRSNSGAFTAALTLTPAHPLVDDDETTPSNIALYRRSVASTGAWAQVATASSVDASAGTVTFSNITTRGQYMLARTVNTAPILTRINPEMTTILENDTATTGQRVIDILDGSVFDPDEGGVFGIAITNITAGPGIWQYSVDAGGSWSSIGAVSQASALLLRSQDRIRFLPDTNTGGNVYMAYHAWDQSSGAAGSKVNATATGGTSAFSVNSDTASLNIFALNDAPVYNDYTFSIPEDALSNSAVGTASATDVDGDTLSYSLTSTDYGIFSINPATGQITVTTPNDLDYETTTSYSLTAQVSDGNFGFDTSTITINVTNVFEPVPEAYYQAVDTGMYGDDKKTGPLPVGFNFTYFGNTYSDFYVGTNGYISFGNGYTHYQNNDMPHNNVPRNYIAPFWDDLMSYNASQPVLYLTTGTAPNRQLIVQWTNYGYYGSSLPMGTIQVILYESSNDVQFQYRQLLTDSRSRGQSATIGMENSSGTVAAKYSYNTAVLDEWQAIRFSWNGVNNYNITDPVAYDGILLGKGGTPPPSIPELTYPTLGITASTAPNLQWESSTGAGSYRLIVSRFSNLNSPDVDVSGLAGTSYNATGLTPLSNYYWAVVATNAAGDTWSQQGVFVTRSDNRPVAVAQTVSLVEDTAAVIDLNGTDDNGDTLTAYISTLPASGSLYQYVSGTTGAQISSINTLVSDPDMKVIYIPVADGSGAGYGNFQFVVADQVKNSLPSVVTVNVTPVNDAPVGVSESYAINEGATLNVAAPGLLANDTDADGDALNALLLNTAMNGSITLNPDGSFSYSHDGTETTVGDFTYLVWDGTIGGTAVRVPVAVTLINDIPVNTVPGSQSINEDASLVFSSTAATLLSTTDEDAFFADVQVQLNVSNGTLTLNSTAGLTSAIGDGTASVTLTGNLIDINAAMDGLTYVPTANWFGTETLLFYTSDLGNTGNPGAMSDLDAVSITVASVNDAPVLDNSGTMSMVDILEDDNNPASNTVEEILLSAGGDRITDADTGAVEGIAITSTSGAFGSWQYSLDNGGSWSNFPAISAASALLLSDNAKVRYLPISDQSGFAAFSFVAWDRSDGLASGTGGINATVTGGSSPFSSASEDVGLTVVAVNDAPTLSLPGGQETDEDIIKQLSAIIVSDSDIGSSDFEVSINATQSIFTLNSTTGLTFALGDGTSDSGMLFTGNSTDVSSALNGIYLLGDLNFSGTVLVEVGVSDQGASGLGGVKATTNTMLVLINELNDPPVLDNSQVMSFSSINEDDTNSSGDYIYNLINSSTANGSNAITDPDGVVPEGIAVTGLTGTGTGDWQYSVNNGGSWNPVGAVSDTSALLLSSASGTLLRYVPNAHWNGTATATFKAWDMTTGSQGNKENTTIVTSTEPYSSASESADLVVVSVTDPPVLGLPSNISTFEDTPASFATITLTDADAGANPLRVDLSVSNGFVSLASLTGLGFLSGDGEADASVSFTGTLSDLNSALNGVTIYPSSDYTGNVVLTVSANDQGNVGPTPGSALATLTVTVNPLNDASVLSGIHGDSVAWAENAAAVALDAGLNGAVSDIDSADLNGGSLEVAFLANNTGNDRITLVSQGSVVVSGTSVSYGGLGIGTVSGGDDGVTPLRVDFNSVSATPTAASALLQSLRFSNVSENPSTLPRSLRLRVRDGDGGISLPADISIAVSTVNDAPVISQGASVSVTLSEDSDPIPFGLSLSASDIDSTVLSWSLLSGPANGSATIPPASGILTTPSYTPAPDFNGSDSFAVQVADGEGGTDSITVNVTVQPVNDLSVIANTTTLDYIENNPATPISPYMTLVDVDNSNLAWVSVRITTNYLNTEDRLEYSGSIASSWDAGTGTLTLTGPDTVANFMTALRSVGYRNLSDNLSTSDRGLVWLANDTIALATSATSSITLTTSNDPPVIDQGNSVTFGMDEDGSPVPFSGVITLTDPDDTLFTWTITSAPGIGALTVNSTKASATLNYIPPANYYGYDYFEISVADGPGATDSIMVTVQINSVNDVPLAVADSYSLAEGATLQTTPSTGVQANDSDIDLDALTTVVDSIPANGSLSMNTDGSFTYTHNGSETVSDSFVYHVNDGTTNSGNVTVSLTISPVNDAPVMTVPGAQGTNEDSAVVFNSTNSNLITFSDADANNSNLRLSANTSNGTITLGGPATLVSLSGNGTSSVTAEGNSTVLLAALNGLAFTPTLNWNGLAVLSVSVDDLGNSGSGGAKYDSEAIAVSVLPVNDAPVLDNSGSMTLTAIDEENTDSVGDTVAAILASAGGDRITDPDSLPQEGIAVTTLDTSLGTWQYSLNSGGSWTAFPAVSESSALLLDTGAMIRLVPNSNANGSTSLDFRAWDRTDGQAPGTTADTLTNGGITSFSTATENATITINPVNDSPIITFPSSTPANEDEYHVINGISVSDVDILAGNMAITLQLTSGFLTLGNTAGLSFSSGDGTSDAGMAFVGTLADVNNALRLTTYLGQPDFNGVEILTLSVHDGGNTGSGGILGTTDTLIVMVGEVNDAPVLYTGQTMTFSSIVEDDTNSQGMEISDLIATSSDNSGDPIIDVDGNNLPEGIALTTIDNSNGVWEYTLNSGGAWSPVSGLVSGNVLMLADSSGTRLRFVPNSDFSGNSSITLRAWDKTDGINGQTTNASAIGGITAFSLNTLVATITVVGANDAPVITMPAPQVETEDTNMVLAAILVDDLDIGAGSMTAELSVSTGVLTLPSVAGLSFSVGDGIADSAMTFSGPLLAVNTALNGIIFRGETDYNGTLSLSLTVNDQGNTGGGALTDSDTLPLTVTPVNDNPALLNLHGDTISFTEKSSAVLIDSGSNAQIADPDGDSMNGGALTVSFHASCTGNDRLTLSPNGTVSLAGTTVSVNGKSVGVLSGGDNGVTPLLVQFNTQFATPSNIAEIIRAIRFENISSNPSTTTRTLRLVLQDGSGGTSGNADIQVTVVPVNDSPVITEGSGITVTMSEDGIPVPFFAALHATDVDSSTLTWSLSSGPANGMATVSGTGAAPVMSYVPNANWYGTDQFTAMVSDGGGASDTATVTIVVTPVNDAPVITQAPSVSVTMSEDSNPTPFTLTLNASDIDGDTLTWSLLTAATNGTAVVSGTGTSNSPSYTPNADVFGSDQFSVQVSDGNGGTTSVTVAVTIQPVNDAPVISGFNDTLQYYEEDPARPLDAGQDFTLADIDTTDFAGAVLSVVITENGLLTEDDLNIASAGNIAFSSSVVTWSGTPIAAGDYNPATLSLTLTFTTGSTAAQITEIVKNIVYSNTNSAKPSTLTRKVQIKLTEQDGLASNTQNASVQVFGVNDAPTSHASLVSAPADALYPLVSKYFPFIDVDEDSMKAVSVGPLGGKGFLMVGDAIMNSTKSFTVAELDSGVLSYFPFGEASGAVDASFYFSVSDGQLWSATSSLFEIQSIAGSTETSANSSNQPPYQLVLQPSTDNGVAPLEVTFAFSARDPEEDAGQYGGIASLMLNFRSDYGILSYETGKAGSIKHVFNEAGDYSVALIALDVHGGITELTVPIHVNSLTPTPITTEETTLSGQVPFTVSYDWRDYVSDELEGKVKLVEWDYTWDKVGDFVAYSSNASATSASHVFREAGTFASVLKVHTTDNEIFSSKVLNIVATASGNPSPSILAFLPVPNKQNAPLYSKLTCYADPGAGASITSYRWWFGDNPELSVGAETQSNTISHSWNLPGVYEVKVEVVNSFGLSATATRHLTVRADGNPFAAWGEAFDGPESSLVFRDMIPLQVVAPLPGTELTKVEFFAFGASLGTAVLNKRKNKAFLAYNVQGMDGLESSIEATAYGKRNGKVFGPLSLRPIRVKVSEDSRIHSGNPALGINSKDYSAVWSNSKNQELHAGDGSMVLVPWGLESGGGSGTVSLNLLGDSKHGTRGTPAGYRSIKRDVRVQVTGGTTVLHEPSKLIHVRLAYDDADNDGMLDSSRVAEKSLKAYRWESSSGAWVPVEYAQYDIYENTVYVKTAHLSDFALFGERYVDGIIGAVHEEIREGRLTEAHGGGGGGCLLGR